MPRVTWLPWRPNTDTHSPPPTASRHTHKYPIRLTRPTGPATTTIHPKHTPPHTDMGMQVRRGVKDATWTHLRSTDLGRHWQEGPLVVVESEAGERGRIPQRFQPCRV
ncbi:hypothetical protein E3U43_021665 [Larimichthys crocea]|uniref:Uncharacterized protein n=1 Tax=Larimichthys crocea TaxID=215358 RepID=A0ACD3R939_LARCR|nr:hypothetical protein E3U43_021665 [Larimichthys crocea]